MTQSQSTMVSHPKENSCRIVIIKGKDLENHSLIFIWEIRILKRETALNNRISPKIITSRLWPRRLLIVVNQTYKDTMLEPQFPKKFRHHKINKPYSQDRLVKSSTIVSLNSHLLPKQVILQRIRIRSTRIRSWFCRISESIEELISLQ